MKLLPVFTQPRRLLDKRPSVCHGHDRGGVLRNRRRATKARPSPRSGFTLPEVLSAITLLIVGVFSTYSLMALAIRVDQEASHYSIARAVAQTTIENLRTQTTRPTAGTSSLSGVSNMIPGGSGTLTATHLESSGQTALDRVQVTIQWPEPVRQTDSYTISTYICSGGVSVS